MDFKNKINETIDIDEVINIINNINSEQEWFSIIDEFKEYELAGVKEKLELINDQHLDKIECNKLFNKFLLEINRKYSNVSLINELSNDRKGDLLESKFKRFNEDFKKIEGEQETLKDEISKFHGSSITVLSIFGAILIAFFSGANLFSSALTSLGNEGINIYEVALICIVVGIIVFNIIYMLISCIFKLLNNRALHENNDGQINLMRLKKEATIVYYFNIGASILLASIGLFYGLDRYNIPSLLTRKLAEENYIHSVTGLLIVILIITIIGVIFIASERKKMKKEFADFKEKNIIKEVKKKKEEDIETLENTPIKEIDADREAAITKKKNKK